MVPPAAIATTPINANTLAALRIVGLSKIQHDQDDAAGADRPFPPARRQAGAPVTALDAAAPGKVLGEQLLFGYAPYALCRTAR